MKKLKGIKEINVGDVGDVFPFGECMVVEKKAGRVTVADAKRQRITFEKGDPFHMEVKIDRKKEDSFIEKMRTM